MEWFGALPERWEHRKINDLFIERREKVSDTDFEPLSVSKGGIVPQIATVAKSNAGENRKKVCRGDFVINSRSDRRGSSGISDYDGSVSLINITLKPRRVSKGRYFHYLLRSHRFIEEYYRNGRGIVADLWTTRYTEMKRINLPLPPREEQDQIVRYLDWKVSQINKLINARKKQVALLQEQKQAVINRAVTKGGEGWKKYQLAKIANVILSGLDKKSYDGQTPVLLCNYVDVYKNDNITSKFDFMKATASESEKANLKLHFDDVVITKDSESWDDIGVPAYVAEEIEDLYCGYHLAIIRSNKEILNGEYLAFAFQSQYVQIQYKIKARGVTRFSLGYQPIHDTNILIPPLECQLEIVRDIKNKCQSQDTCVAVINQQITLLQEYLTRLISDVVTGKLDVRDVNIPDYESVEEVVEPPDMETDETEGEDNAD